MARVRAAELVERLLAALRDSTSPDNFCQRLALTVLRDYQVESTFITRLDSDACLTMVGSWGYPPERRRVDDRPSIRTPMAITDAIREGEIKVFETWEAYLDRYPQLEHKAGPGNAIVCVPFSPDGNRSGGFGITNTEIAVKMRFSPSLIKKELQELYRIFGVSDCQALAALATNSRSWPLCGH